MFSDRTVWILWMLLHSCTIVLGTRDSNFDYMLKNTLSHRIMDGPLIPHKRITAMKQSDRLLYLALDNGAVMVQNLINNADHDMITFHSDPGLIQSGATITQILPMLDAPSAVATLLYIADTDDYAVSIHWISSWEGTAQIVYLQSFDHPVCILSESQELKIISADSIISVSCIGDESPYPSTLVPITGLPERPITTCAVIDNPLNPQYKGYLVQFADFWNELYIIHRNNLTVTLIHSQDPSDFPFETITSWVLSSNLVPTTFGYLTLEYLIEINSYSGIRDGDQKSKNRMIPYSFSEMIEPFNLSTSKIEAVDIQQHGQQLTFLLLHRSPITNKSSHQSHHNELHVVFGTIPTIESIESEKEIKELITGSGSGRRLLLLSFLDRFGGMVCTAERSLSDSSDSDDVQWELEGIAPDPRIVPVPVPVPGTSAEVEGQPPSKRIRMDAVNTKRLRQAMKYSKLVPRCDSHTSLGMGLICSIDCVPYEIQMELGRGAHGAVYKALMYEKNDRTNILRTVAIKLIKDTRTFVDENKIMHQLKGTLGVTQWITASQPLPKGQSKSNLIVMRYIAGGDLQHFMDHPPMALVGNNRALEIVKMFMLDISYPLEVFNNQLQWLHADIKPANILVDMKGETQNFYLSDMSCSLSIDNYISGEGAGGTLTWMSPEMVSSWSLRRGSFPSQMCIDAYGLELVAIHLYAALCKPKPDDLLCDTAREFPKIQDQIKIESHGSADKGVSAYNNAFRRRSQRIQRLYATLKVGALPLGSFRRRQNGLVNVLSKHLVRIPRYKEESTEYIRSHPSVCITWERWRRMVEMI